MARPNVPWYRSSKDCWYVKLGGRTLSLKVRGSNNQKQALVAFGRLLEAQPKPKVTQVAAPQTVRSAFDRFLTDARVRLKDKTVLRYDYDCGVFVRSCGSLPLKTLNADHLRKWLLSLCGSSTTKAIMLRSVSAFLGWCVREELLEFNPAKRVAKPKTKSRTDSALISEEGHQRLLAAATREFKLVLRTLRGTGCRPGEIEKLTAEAFQPDTSCFLLWEHKTDRSGRPRAIFLTEELTELFKKQRVKFNNGPLLRSRKGKGWTARGISEVMARLRRKTGVNAIAYGYRHTFVTDGLKGNVSTAKMAALVGHSSQAVIDKHYSHLGTAGKELLEALKFRKSG